ncbi:MAG: GTP 3',8-cyclase MoaA [Candidatus Freyarchaeota archaeon]
MVCDRFGRPIRDIRVSLTHRCNLRCIYCHGEGELSPSGELEASEIERIVGVAAGEGVRRVKLTGGEPLLRRDIFELVERVSMVPGIEEVSMTTNATLLADKAWELREVGLRRVNISLDSLVPEKYREITGFDELDSVLCGIDEALAAGLSPIKLNMVLLRGLNENEFWDLVRFSQSKGAILQVIELVDLGNEVFQRFHMDVKPLEEELGSYAERVVTRRSMQNRKKYFLPGGAEVEVVRPVHNSDFCSNCTRIRLTSDGKLKPCLMRSDNLVDIVGPLRRGADSKTLRELFLKAVELREPYYGTRGESRLSKCSQ